MCNRSGRSPLSDLSESGDTFGVSGNMWVTDTLLEKRRGIGRIGDTVWSLVCEKYSSHESYIQEEIGTSK